MDDISVLIVEDDPELLAAYEGHLQDAFDVKTAASGREALSIVNEDVDVLLLDRKMPGMDGDAVLDALRDRGYTLPVAMVTGVEPDVDIVDMSFDEYLTKPVDRDALVDTVQVLANRATFEQKSREFFQLASKKASLNGRNGAGEPERNGASASTDRSVSTNRPAETEDLIGRITELQADLDHTLEELVAAGGDPIAQATPNDEEIEDLLVAISEHSLPDDVSALVEAYQSLESARPPFMWKWVHRLAPQNELPCVDDEYAETVATTKTIIILFITLLDDTLEKHQDPETFRELARIPFEDGLTDEQRTFLEREEGIDAEYVTFADRVWAAVRDRLHAAPAFDEYEELFRYDLKQAINSIEYSDLAIRRPDLATMSDLERYESHNMVMFAYADLDLMHSSVDAREELPTIREAIWSAQQMARIGNWVSTWQRELREGDYCSGPIVYALENGIVTHQELREARGDRDLQDRLLERIDDHGVESTFLMQWEKHRLHLREYDEELSTMDLGPFIDGTEEVLRYHLASTGLK